VIVGRNQDIQIKNIVKSYNGDPVIEDLSLWIPAGKFFALLGPSGCGKTTLLRLIGGFEQAQAGHIYLGSRDITHAPINQRHINTVFQNYALFPHMNVFDNVGYSLAVRGVEKDEIERRVMRLLRSFGLERHTYKSIRYLSGGQQQRVALARAIINEPDVLLLDEPLAALDFKLREKMLLELIDLQDELKTTFIYVTHDQFEALTVADQMAIMNSGGTIEQVGTPKEIYEFPVSSFVAKFVGTTNILEGMAIEKEGTLYISVPQLGDFEVVASPAHAWVEPGRNVHMSIRPEKIFITRCDPSADNIIQGTVESIVYHGRSTQYNVRLHNHQLLQVFEQNEEHVPSEVIDYDDVVNVYWQKENVVLLQR